MCQPIGFPVFNRTLYYKTQKSVRLLNGLTNRVTGFIIEHAVYKILINLCSIIKSLNE